MSARIFLLDFVGNKNSSRLFFFFFPLMVYFFLCFCDKVLAFSLSRFLTLFILFDMILILDFIQICSIAQAFLEYSLGFLFGFTL